MTAMIAPPSAFSKDLRNRFEALSVPSYGNVYRASAQVKGGILLPCVAFSSRNIHVELLSKRFREQIGMTPQLDQSVEIFCSWGSRIDASDVLSVEPSSCALSNAQIGQIIGETRMSWTCFVGEMGDGTRHNFATAYYPYFFEMPHGYSAFDIVKIHSDHVVLENGDMVHARDPGLSVQRLTFHRELAHFDCYLTDL